MQSLQFRSGECPLRSLIALGGLAALCFSQGGCAAALVGHWRMSQLGQFREVLCIDDATFYKDGDFEATLTIEGRTAREGGKYSYDGFKLHLRPSAGGVRIYDASLRSGNLEIRDGVRRVVLRRTGDPASRRPEAPPADRSSPAAGAAASQ